MLILQDNSFKVYGSISSLDLQHHGFKEKNTSTLRLSKKFIHIDKINREKLKYYLTTKDYEK